jgi:hypothetical protein
MAAAKRPEDRHKVDFPVFLSFQDTRGAIQRVTARCVDLSPSGARLETRDKLAVRENVLVHSEKFGRMGLASIRYCVRLGMKYSVGMQFAATFRLSDPVRKKILNGVVQPGTVLE